MVDRLLYENTAKFWANICEAEICSWTGYSDFKLAKLTLDWKESRRSSRGGWYKAGPGINLAMTKYVYSSDELYRVYEYPSFDSDPIIGGFYSDNPHLYLAMTVCHEMAHAAQFYAHNILKKLIDKPHGDTFKTPYKALRIRLLNPILPNQLELKNRYEKEYNGL